MKKTLLLSALLLVLISLVRPERASAQITGVTITGSDSFMTYCVLPNRSMFNINGALAGTVPTSGDSCTVYVNWDDGSDTTFRVRNYSYGGSAGGYFFAYCMHTYAMPGTYTVYYSATATSSVTGTYVAPSFTLSDECARLKGKLYVDANSNCTPDAGELGIPYVPIMVVNTGTSDTSWGGWSNDTGHYTIDMLAGSYNIIPNPSWYSWWWYYYYYSSITPTCPSTGAYSFTAASSTTYTKNFAYTCTPPDSLDVMATGYGWGYVPGDSSYVSVWVGNWWWWWGFSCSSLSSTITLTLDPMLTYAGTPSFATAPSTVSGTSGATLTWNYSSTSITFGFWTMVKVVTSSSAALGDSLCNTVSATATSIPDPNMANNTYTFCNTVLSSWDPNEKAVSPQGSGAPGYINNNTPLSYEIHFQNTGTAPARNVTVVDTLSPNVDPKTLHVFHSSAPVTIYTSGRIVKFRFNDINLPDSASNPDGSIGSIIYGVMPKAGLAGGTQIKNKAGIYFDYNPAVWTNTTLNTIFGTTAVQHIGNDEMQAIVYPNPATDQVYARTEDKSNFTITMTDVLGRVVANGTSANGSAALNTQSLASGLYIVKLTNSNGKEVTAKVTIQR